MKPVQKRIALIDVLKVVAIQVIVLHHLVSYGPLADAAQDLFPGLVGWLYDHGRIAVQIFIVIGGYLAARVLSPHGEAFHGRLWATIANRYLRLAPPYVFALVLAVVSAVFARRWIDDSEFIPAAPGVGQALAHLFLLHDLFDYEALSAGVWYVAIDFQLFVVLTAVLWLGARMGALFGTAVNLGMAGVLLLDIASLFCFNRNPDYDIWAVYFFSAYGLGAITYWADKGRQGALQALRILWLAALFALLLDFRWRLLVALCTALSLHAMAARWLPLRRQLPRWVHGLAHTSYALFLVHFPIYMLVSALFVKHGLIAGPWSGVIGLALTWLFSIGAAFLLHRWIEVPAGRMRIGAVKPHAQPIGATPES